jgi:hypothetical protein
MKDKLPKVYAVPITKKINNNKEIFKSGDNDIRSSRVSKKDIENIFKDKTHVYKTKVLITTNNGKKEVDVVGISNNNLLTLNGDVINIGDIIEIKKV